MIVDNRTAGREAVLVAFERRQRDPRTIGEKIVGVEPAVAQELIQYSVKLIAAGFDHHIHDPASGPSELRRVAVGLHLELFDGVRGWKQADHKNRVSRGHRVRNAIDEHFAGSAKIAVDHEQGSGIEQIAEAGGGSHAG